MKQGMTVSSQLSQSTCKVYETNMLTIVLCRLKCMAVVRNEQMCKLIKVYNTYCKLVVSVQPCWATFQVQNNSQNSRQRKLMPVTPH